MYFPRRRPLERLPRRMSEEDVEEEYRKKKFGTPGPIDAWLAARIGQGAHTSSSSDSDSDLDSPPASDEVRCTVQLQRVKAPDDDPESIFADPDTFVLHLTTGSHAFEPARRVVLGTYEGYPESLDAPQWAKLPAGVPVVFRASIAAVTDLLKTRCAIPEPGMDAVTALLQSLQAVSLDG
ncbi:hypothetical protein L226DRAFT_532418 [Lentinus tigrinus ALCF2SS1-7]|uniref:Uncharacterized protein n=1 Tax=Lentinus tigrinus ALCF2SS1-6 TaxID=1328759 RepID=A0A5C2SFT3_9APHY|nr:hypothetical protein L227DRAFT_573145 [Lentinus tigrinus ALCF2SS1-6]RPD77641.1 hypothetical protein L226DRAFT_532418 [Lentinus tigrinus ALCF2SS1-7]